MLLGVMKAPLQKLVGTLAAPQVKLVRTLVAIRDQKQARLNVISIPDLTNLLLENINGCF